jgi:hypothetical protein
VKISQVIPPYCNISRPPKRHSSRKLYNIQIPTLVALKGHNLIHCPHNILLRRGARVLLHRLPYSEGHSASLTQPIFSGLSPSSSTTRPAGLMPRVDNPCYGPISCADLASTIRSCSRGESRGENKRRAISVFNSAVLKTSWRQLTPSTGAKARARA